MIFLDPTRDIDYIINRVATDRILTDEEVITISNLVASGYSKVPPRDLIRVLAMPVTVANPTPQASSMYTYTPPLSYEMKVMIRKGLATLEDFEVSEVVWDPNWQPEITLPSPLETLGFPPGTILTMRDIQRILR